VRVARFQMANANMPRRLSSTASPQARYPTSKTSVSESVANSPAVRTASSARRSR
jgi:hypothetical protein